MQVQIVEYSQTAAALGELRQKYENVVFPVDTTAGMKDSCVARKELRDIRVGLEKMRQEIKAPALERCRLIDAEAKAITASLTALEDPIDTQIKAEEQRKEREKQERKLAEREKQERKLAEREKQERKLAERERVEAIRKKIEGIRALPVALSGESSAEIAAEIEALEQFTPGEEFAEFVGEADTTKSNALNTLRAMHERQAAQEAEAARLAAEQEKLRAEREELERMRREIAAAKAAEAESAAKATKAIETAAAAIAEDVGGTVTDFAFDQATSTVRMSLDLDDNVITAEPEIVAAAADFIHRTRIERHRNYPNAAVEFALGPANIALTFCGKTGEPKAAEVL